MPGNTVFLVEILLPLQDRQGARFPPALFDDLAQHLTERFGGVTSFSRSPAEGRWRQGAATEHDDIVVIEVMTGGLDRPWWSALRKELMRSFRQDDVLIRSRPVEILL